MTTSPPTTDPFPWDDGIPADTIDDTPTIDSVLNPSPTDLERTNVFVDTRAAEGILDDCSADAVRRETAGGIRETLIDVVRRRADRRRSYRTPDDLKSATDVRAEAVGAADDAETLDALGDAFKAAAKEAREVAGELIDEVPRARSSFKVADGQGFELTVRREKRTEVSVSFDDVVDVISSATLAQAVDHIDSTEVQSYAGGIRAGIAALRDVLSSSPGFRSTALDSLATRLEDAGEDALAKRLRAAYGRVEKGEPMVKLERRPIVEKGGRS